MDTLSFAWDDTNIGHLAEHGVKPEEAEQVILNRPIDLESQLRNGEKRVAQVGETDAGRILIVVTASGEKVRVITAWPAKGRLQRYFVTQKRNGNVGRVEEQDVRE
ncbi:MAG: BrnT family toxin [Terracidiphilus sp.]